ncbi:MAG: DUF4349 domain-containing protein [Acidobacteria bacterium]|nr:DUF4349 domain-containing protein [Acidobacteriota bacterium]
MKRLSLAALLLASLLFSACGASERSGSLGSPTSVTSEPEYQNASSANTAPASVADQARKTGGGGGGGRNEPAAETISVDQASASQQTTVPADRKIIRNAELDLESEAPDEAQTRITAIAEQMGGFVVESQQSSSDVRSSRRDIVSMTIRVPSAKFGETLEAIRNASGRVVVESVKGQDVTQEFIDIEARLKAQQALEAQFTEIMKRANTVEDALEVQRQLAVVRGEIEKIEGRKRFLENQSSLSTIKLRIRTPAVISAGGPGFFTRLTDSINTGLDSALDFVLGLITVLIAALPFLLFICLPAYLISRYFWRKARRRMTAAKIIEEELKGE